MRLLSPDWFQRVLVPIRLRMAAKVAILRGKSLPFGSGQSAPKLSKCVSTGALLPL